MSDSLHNHSLKFLILWTGLILLVSGYLGDTDALLMFGMLAVVFAGGQLTQYWNSTNSGNIGDSDD